MKTRYSRLSQLLELVAMLQTSASGISLDQMIDHFSVSRRTAERMLAALRVSFPDLEATLRDGRKHWRMPLQALARGAGALKPPPEIEALSKRVEQLTAELADARAAGAINSGIVDHALAQSVVGIFILDADFRVVWTNEALRRYFGLKSEDVHGRDKGKLIRTRIREIMMDGEQFELRVLGTYADNTYLERFECRIEAGPGREQRRLRHWSQPIRSGIYAGGRIEHYIDITERDVTARPPAVDAFGPHGDDLQAGSNPVVAAIPNEPPPNSIRSIRTPLASLVAAAKGAQQGVIDPSAALEQILHSSSRIAAILEEGRRNSEAQAQPPEARRARRSWAGEIAPEAERPAKED